ncbi:MAG: DUF2892 domain-containing protein [Nanoarchaeota archaeon]|nr:DUF2892 domain-containing protein [Nanoarchaeota archaeon]
MNLQKYLNMLIGFMVFISSVLGYFHSPYWLFFTMFVGLNLFQYAFTDFCLLSSILRRLGVKD